jgi:CCR4-NOT transcription complex subunit 7/8
MDTEFPGVVARPYGTFRSHTDYQYQTLKCNVDLLRIIQVPASASHHSRYDYCLLCAPP